ncbi:MAG: molybdate ABC transporter permease subunit [Pseudomonadota bacterium]
MSATDWQALWLTIRLALITTTLLLVIATPLAWWLSRSRSFATAPVSVLVALPLVLPPTVIGFYLLLLLSPRGFIGELTAQLGMGSLVFTFTGLVIGSLVYSLPFVVQPLRTGFAAIETRTLEQAALAGASAWDRFFTVALPLNRHGYVSAAVLGFAHTLGEFGIVLMIGGNIPGQTALASVQIYQHVETLQYANAHRLSLVLVAIAIVTLSFAYALTMRASTTKTGHV